MEPAVDSAAQGSAPRVNWFSPTWLPLVVWGVGQIFRDRWNSTAICFYLPTILVSAWYLLAVVVASVRGNRPRRRAYATALALTLGVVLFLENQWQEPATEPITEEPLLAMHWNVNAGAGDWGGVLEEGIAIDADLVVITEPAYRLSPADVPQYQLMKFDEFAIVAKGELSGTRSLENDRHLDVAIVDWQSRQGPLKVMLCDIKSYLRNSRHRALGIIHQHLEREQPDLVLGDFNAPRRSWRLAYLPTGYQHAYHAAGAGWSGTWPYPLWLYSLDHILCGERIVPLRYDLISAPPSDHARQEFSFDVRKE
jgi:vancomycin resistance protein VanJ